MEENPSHLKETFHLIGAHKFIFAAFFLFIFVVSYGFLYLLDLVPSELRVVTDGGTEVAAPKNVRASVTTGELPVHITIDKIGVNSVINNTNSTKISDLDALLTKGVVRYPGSGLAGKGNLFLFGHSTGLRVVNNQAYKAFNNLKNLQAGDEIAVYSETKKYIYSVRDVKMVSSEDAWVDLSVKTNMLTLSTCNTFGKKEDRYVVQADFSRVESLTKS